MSHEESAYNQLRDLLIRYGITEWTDIVSAVIEKMDRVHELLSEMRAERDILIGEERDLLERVDALTVERDAAVKRADESEAAAAALRIAMRSLGPPRQVAGQPCFCDNIDRTCCAGTWRCANFRSVLASDAGKYSLAQLRAVDADYERLRDKLQKLNVLNDIRAAGWSVAVHNDYRSNGKQYTFWLFTHANGRWVKGEGATDAEALEQVRLAVNAIAASHLRCEQ